MFAIHNLMPCRGGGWCTQEPDDKEYIDCVAAEVVMNENTYSSVWFTDKSGRPGNFTVRQLLGKIYFKWYER